MFISGLNSGASYSYGIRVQTITVSVSVSSTTAALPVDPPVTPEPASTPPSVSRDQFRNDLTALFAAVRDGDMSGAQQALKTVQADRPELFAGDVRATNGKAALQVDFNALVQAVQSGDASAAQESLGRLRSDVRPGHGHGHHHHHHHDSRSSETLAGTGTAVSTGPAVEPAETTDNAKR